MAMMGGEFCDNATSSPVVTRVGPGITSNDNPNNQLTKTRVGTQNNTNTYTYTYNEHGSMKLHAALIAGNRLEWNGRNAAPSFSWRR